jgi:NAD(P)-dependent dehydrogenase (short-subunit alcohol dehydrogenase family)
MNSPDYSVKDKIALITGAGRGIGMAIAENLAAQGAAVAVQDIELAVALEVADRINKAGGKAVAFDGDASDTSIAPRWVNQTVEQLGGINILINNAAVQKVTPWMEVSPEEMEWQYRANIITPLRLAAVAVPHFKTAKWGRIINVGSIQMLRGTPFMLAYSMTKAAMHNMTTGMARDLAGDQITVNTLAPGYFNTYRNRKDFQKPEDLEIRGKRIPIGRIGEPVDCVGVTLLLCSEAGSYITGQVMHVDGGMSL